MKSISLVLLFIMLSSCTTHRTRFVSNGDPNPPEFDSESILFGVDDSLNIAELRIESVKNDKSYFVIASLADMVWKENSELTTLRPKYIQFFTKISKHDNIQLILIQDQVDLYSLVQLKNQFFEMGWTPQRFSMSSSQRLQNTTQITGENVLVYLGNSVTANLLFERLSSSPLMLHQIKMAHILIPEYVTGNLNSAKNSQ